MSESLIAIPRPGETGFLSVRGLRAYWHSLRLNPVLIAGTVMLLLVLVSALAAPL